jgi:hypothetical protein
LNGGSSNANDFEMPSFQTDMFPSKNKDGLSSGKGKGALYDAYNQLHTLAQVRY